MVLSWRDFTRRIFPVIIAVLRRLCASSSMVGSGWGGRGKGKCQARTISCLLSLEYSRYSAAPSQMLRVRFWRSS